MKPASNLWRETSDRTPQSTAPTIPRRARLRMAGTAEELSNDTLDRYELQNYTSMSHGKHFLKFAPVCRHPRFERIAVRL